MTSNAPVLRLQNVAYRDIVTGVTAEWTTGQMIGLIGPNGAGKSTLLRLVAGIWTPTEGSVLLHDKELHSMNLRKRAAALAYLPQQMPENVLFTVYQYVEMGRYADLRAFRGHRQGSRDAVMRALEKVNLLPYKDVPLEHLSGGERQRAGIARCLAQGSPVILLDEPISNLDLYYQVDILTRLRKLAHEGYLVVVSIHNLELAAQYCTELMLLENGQVYRESTPEHVLSVEALRDVFQVEAKLYRDPHNGFLRISHLSDLG